MHERERGHAARVLQVLVIHADLGGEQHALVDHGARRHRGHVELAPVLQVQALDGVARALADDIELPLERVGGHDVAAAADEHLPDQGLARLDRRRHLHRRVDRNVAPAQQHLTLRAHRALDLFLAGEPGGRLLGQEHHAHAILPRGRELDAERSHLLPVAGVRNLDQDAGAVAHQPVGPDRAAMVEVLQDEQPVLDDAVALRALDVGDEAHPAGIVLAGAIVESGSAGDAIVFGHL